MLTLRSLRGQTDLASLQAVDQTCVAAGELDAADVIQEIENPIPLDWVLAEWEGQVVGYGHTSYDWLEKDGTRVYLHLGRVQPAYRRHGVGSALLAALEGRCRARAADSDHLNTLELAANASEREADATAFLQKHGYFTAYTILEMRLRQDGPLPEPPALPAGYEFRPLLPEHHLAVWQSIGNAYDARDLNNPRFGEVPQDDEYDWYFSQDPGLTFVVWRDRMVAGQVIGRVRDDGVGRLLEVSVGLGHQRRGLARTLMLHALHELARRGVTEVWLSTRQENPSGAPRQYEKLGFRTVTRSPRWRKSP